MHQNATGYAEHYLISRCNEALKSYSNCIQIKTSSIGDSGKVPITTRGLSTWIFRYSEIGEGEPILKAPTALGVCSQHSTTHCYNCSEVLGSPQIFSFHCCPNMRFCSTGCQRISERQPIERLTGRDLPIARASTSFKSRSKTNPPPKPDLALRSSAPYSQRSQSKAVQIRAPTNELIDESDIERVEIGKKAKRKRVGVFKASQGSSDSNKYFSLYVMSLP
jgi:hypothetical protein